MGVRGGNDEILPRNRRAQRHGARMNAIQQIAEDAHGIHRHDGDLRGGVRHHQRLGIQQVHLAGVRLEVGEPVERVRVGREHATRRRSIPRQGRARRQTQRHFGHARPER